MAFEEIAGRIVEAVKEAASQKIDGVTNGMGNELSRTPDMKNNLENPMSESIDPNQKVEKNLEKTDDNGNVYTDEKGDLLPNTEYTLNENTYQTDEEGRIVTCDATLKESENEIRDKVAQKKVGGEDRKQDDHGGHIISRDLGGDGGVGNLIPMDSRINQSDYRGMENDLKDDLKKGKEVTTHTEPGYHEKSKRPDIITVTKTVDGQDTVYTFDNNLDGSLMDKVEETGTKDGIENVKDKLNETGGEISSIKEEFDTDGNLEKSTVTITYLDENKNYRTQVEIKHTGGNS